MDISPQSSDRKRLIKSGIWDAMDRNELYLHYQPQVHLKSGNPIGVEALVRWNHKALGHIQPGEFIPVAEDLGAISRIGNWVFRTASQHLPTWKSLRNHDLHLSVNVSPREIRNGSINPSAWVEHLDSVGVPCSCIVLEITEGLLMENDPEVKNQIEVLQRCGMKIAIDDFGTGFSSLSYLKNFDVSFIKIDKAFIRDIATDRKDVAICQAIISLAHALGITVIGEGVETPEQLQVLTDLGCDAAQGFLFGRPQGHADFQSLLKGDRGFFSQLES